MPKGYSWPVQGEIVIVWGWIGWRLAKLTSISEEKQILHAGQQQFLGNLRTDAFLCIYTGTNHLLADTELLRSG